MAGEPNGRYRSSFMLQLVSSKYTVCGSSRSVYRFDLELRTYLPTASGGHCCECRWASVGDSLTKVGVVRRARD